MKKQQQGFTLIELVIVIVILGILAVTAAPRFLDLGSDAREAAMRGVLGALRSATQITHAGLLVDPVLLTVEGVAIQIDANGDGDLTDTGDLAAPNRYPHAEDMCDLIGLTTTGGAAGALGTDDTTDTIVCTTTATVVTIQDTAATTPAQCQITYTEATNATTPPVITPTLTGC